MQKLLKAVLLATLIFVSEKLIAAPMYQITDLGTLGGPSSAGYAINNSGQVTGTAQIAGNKSYAFVYSAGTMTNLGGATHSGQSINSSGQIAGYDETAGNDSAFVETAGVIQDLGPLLGTTSRAYGINDGGQVTGYRYPTGGTESHAFLFNAGSVVDLGTLGGNSSAGNSINSNGQITGWAVNAKNVERAFLYSGGVMHDLGALGGFLDEASAGNAINSSGQVTGYAVTSGANTSPYDAFLYNSGGMHDLGTLGGTYSDGLAINSTGEVTGWADVSDGNAHAFLYSNGVMTDLNSLISPSAGWLNLEWGTGINDLGQITGFGTINNHQHAFLLTPVSEPSTVVLACLGLIGLLSATVEKRKRHSLMWNATLE